MCPIYEMYKDVALLFVCHLSRKAEAELVAAGDVKRLAGGGCITTSWNGYSVNCFTGVWHAWAYKSIFSPACILEQLQLSDWVA